MSIRGHVPEKDGILACLLAAEARARRGKPLMQQVRELWEKVGKVVSARVNVHYDPEKRDDVAKRVKAFPKRVREQRRAARLKIPVPLHGLI